MPHHKTVLQNWKYPHFFFWKYFIPNSWFSNLLFVLWKLSGCFHNYTFERKPEDFGQKCRERSSWYLNVLFFWCEGGGRFWSSQHPCTHALCVAVCCSVCCSVLQCVAVCSSAHMQCVKESVLQCFEVCEAKYVAECWSVWSKVCCRVLKFVKQSVLQRVKQGELQCVQGCKATCVAKCWRVLRWWCIYIPMPWAFVCMQIRIQIEHACKSIYISKMRANVCTYPLCMQVVCFAQVWASKFVYVSNMHANVHT